MHRTIPLWLFLLVLLSFGVLMVTFGAAVKTEIEDDARGGTVGDIALRVASLPGVARSVAGEASAYVAQDYDRFLATASHRPPTAGDRPIARADGVELAGLHVRGRAEDVPEGWRVLVGTFDWEGQFRHGAVIVSPQLEAVHFWPIDEAAIGEETPAPPHRRFLHGLALLPDRSVIASFDGGMSLQRVDHCGNAMWRTAGAFHHAVTLAEDGRHVWSLRGDDLVKVDVADGEVRQALSLHDIIAANPDTDILEVRRLHDNNLPDNGRDLEDRFMHDPFHTNDVEPLPAALAATFKGFEAGDLLVSARSLNLVFVVDPDTKRIKWWRSGAWKRQHDPDWAAGTIEVFDNQMNREWSRIVSIDPEGFQTEVLVAGAQYDFYTRIRGKHQRLPDGGRLITSSQQGRAFELSADGEIVLEFLNLTAADPSRAYHLSDYFWLPTDGLATAPACAVRPLAQHRDGQAPAVVLR